jgi:hypothetical protein
MRLANGPIDVQEILIFFVLELVKLVQIFPFKSVLVCKQTGFRNGFFNNRGRRRGFWGDDAVLAKNIVPTNPKLLFG